MATKAGRKSFGVEDLFESTSDTVTTTPLKRSRPAAANGNGTTNAHGTRLNPNATPLSSSTASRPIAGRLGSSPSVVVPNSSSPAAPPPPSTPFHLRPDRLKVIETLSPSLPAATAPTSSAAVKPRTKLFSSMDPKKFQYRYQFERLMHRSEMLDQALDEALESLRYYYGIEEFTDPGMQSQEDVYVVGRICAETDVENLGKLSEKTCWLESSRSMGAGSRVLLAFEEGMTIVGNVEGAGGVGLFPGCLVGLKGRNGGGKLFSVSQVLMMPPLDASYTRPSELLESQYGQQAKQLTGAPMSVFVSCGPYTLDADLDYAPFNALMDHASKEKPDVVILLGPFVDSLHPLFASGAVDEFPAQIFKSKISSRLASLIAASPRTSILIVPSTRDLISNHVAYPQSPLPKETEFGLPKGVRLLSNPSTFSINEVVFALTSLDTLFHLNSSQLFKKAPSHPPTPDDPVIVKDMLSRGCRHILRQKSFYPLFPTPPVGKGIVEAVNLDVSHRDLLGISGNGPDVVLLPSRLGTFAKVVDSTVIINPAFLTKSNAAGTFARLTIHPMNKDILERRVAESVEEGQGPDEPIEHRVWERCRVDIVKI